MNERTPTLDVTPISGSLRTLFEEALGLSGEARARFLVERCPDPKLRARMERMLAADANESEALPQDDAQTLARKIGEPEGMHALAPGTRVGPFELLEPLGEGGSSTVYRARREHAGVTQDVALKVLRQGMYSREARRQFDRERRALAQLRHPHIAHLIEGGVTADGLAFIALELIDGQTITDHVRERRLGLKARLRLFIAACRAVEAAHRALIVHRDLKPSNVLVTNDGYVKLVDFGIAKLLGADADDDTRSQVLAFTPAYAAPEQRSGNAITTATDVYALGILLGELITGQRLNDGSGRTPSGEVSEQVEPGVLPAPAPQLRRLLRGDLDNIVLKAIAPEPEQRYVSAGALADDIEMLLAGRPVAAHPPSTWYRARKFLTRHRGAVASTLVFIVAIIASLALALWQARVAHEQAQRAQAQANRANSLRDFMFEAFAEAEPSTPKAGPATVLDVVERAVVTAQSARVGTPDARIELRLRLAQVLDEQGALQQSQALLQTTRSDAFAQLGRDHELSQEATRLLAWNAVLRGDFALARTEIDTLLPTIAPDHGALRVRSLLLSATLATKERQRERARREGQLALELSRQLGDPTLLASALNDYANVLLTLDDIPGAIAAYEELLTGERAQYGSQHVKIAKTEAALSRAYRRMGDLQVAEARARAALAIDTAVYHGDHWRTAAHLNALTAVLKQQRDFAGALTSETESLRIRRATVGDEHPDTLASLYNVGTLRALLEDYAGALAPLRESLERTERVFGPEHWDTAIARANYGDVLARSGEFAAGIAEIDHALASYAALTDPDPDRQALALEKRIRLMLERGDGAAELARIDTLEALVAKIASPDSHWPGVVNTLRGSALLNAGDNAAAQRALQAGRDALQRTVDLDPLMRVENTLLLALATQKVGATAPAVSLAAEGRTALVALRNPPSRLTALAASLNAG